MTEQEWLFSPGPWPMLEHVRSKATARKLRLFGCACCYRIWHLITDEAGQVALAVAERYADGLASHSELAEANHVWVRSVLHRQKSESAQYHAVRAGLCL